MKSFFLFILWISSIKAFSQTDTLLLNQASRKLETGVLDATTILSDKEFISIHDHTGFRELVKKHTVSNRVEMTVAGEPGKRIKVQGRLENRRGEPLPGVLIYFYQTDSKGWYAADRPHVGGNEGDRRHARIFGYVKTDKQGNFELNTVKPSGYPSSDLPAHIHVEILEASGYHPLITEFLFDDDERLVGSIREQALAAGFLLAKPSPSEAPFEQVFDYRIRLNSK